MNFRLLVPARTQGQTIYGGTTEIMKEIIGRQSQGDSFPTVWVS